MVGLTEPSRCFLRTDIAETLIVVAATKGYYTNVPPFRLKAAMQVIEHVCEVALDMFHDVTMNYEIEIIARQGVYVPTNVKPHDALRKLIAARTNVSQKILGWVALQNIVVQSPFWREMQNPGAALGYPKFRKVQIEQTCSLERPATDALYVGPVVHISELVRATDVTYQLVTPS